MLKTFSITDIGKRRKLNQDYVFASEKPLGNLPNIFIVADGMGGHNAGDYASKYAVETIKEEIAGSFEKSPVKILKKAIEAANSHIREKAMEKEDLRGMGTTVVAATCLKDKYLEVANVGDSRLYVVSDSKMEQITRDHSLVEEMVRRGGIAKEAARNHPDRNIITRAIGAEDNVNADFFHVELEPGDMVLMCSDGLTNMLEDEEIHMILSSQENVEVKAEELIKAANNNGGRDNIAVILIEPFAEP